MPLRADAPAFLPQHIISSTTAIVPPSANTRSLSVLHETGNDDSKSQPFKSGRRENTNGQLSPSHGEITSTIRKPPQSHQKSQKTPSKRRVNRNTNTAKEAIHGAAPTHKTTPSHHAQNSAEKPNGTAAKGRRRRRSGKSKKKEPILHEDLHYRREHFRVEETANPAITACAFPALGSNGVTEVRSCTTTDNNLWSRVHAASNLLKEEPLTDAADNPQEEHLGLSTSATSIRLTVLGRDNLQQQALKKRQPFGLFDTSPQWEEDGASQHKGQPHTNRSTGKYDETDRAEQLLHEENRMQLTKKRNDEAKEDALAPVNSLQIRQSTRLDMSKLRDRWWHLLQKSADEKRQQQKLLQLQREQDEREPAERQQGRDDQSSCSELSLSSIKKCDSSLVGGDADHITSDDPGHAAAADLHNYLRYLKPLHHAILNHDETSLTGLLQLLKSTQDPLERLNLLGEGGISGKMPPPHVNATDEHWKLSPLQLTVTLDNPRLTRVLLLAAAAAEEEDRRAGCKGSHCSSSLSIIIHASGSGPTPLMIAANQAHHECAHLLLMHPTVSTSAAMLLSCKDSHGNNALHYCCRSQCETATNLLGSLLMIATSTGGTTPSKILLGRNDSGQTPLHLACQHGRVDLVEVFLSKCGSDAFSVLSKNLVMQDKRSQTPLLAAIASGSTDLVMTLLMWRTNHHHLGVHQRQKASQLSAASHKGASSSCCPILWAVRTCGRVEMVQLLLEFYNPSSSLIVATGPSGNLALDYDLTCALHAAVKLSAVDTDCDGEKLELVRVLVEAGANPCEPREQDMLPDLTGLKASKQSSGGGKKGQNDGKCTISSDPLYKDLTAIAIAVRLGHIPNLSTLLASLLRQRNTIKELRRRDPALRKQPESFFEGLESIEDSEMRAALADGLTTALFLGYGASENIKVANNDGIGCDRLVQSSASRSTVPVVAQENYLAISVVLFRKGARLGPTGLARLKSSLGTPYLKRVDDVITSTPSSASIGCPFRYSFRAGYHHDMLLGGAQERAYLQGVTLRDRSELLHGMPWMKSLQVKSSSRQQCTWLYNDTNPGRRPASTVSTQHLDEVLASDLVALLTDQGSNRIIVHGFIISEKSAKLAAAVHFARASRGQLSQHDDASTIEIDLGTTSTALCILLLQHLYLGSIAVGLPSGAGECCQMLLDLVILAEEFICPSLVQECEMRLLSSSPWQCFCWSCSKTASPVAPQSKDECNECIYHVEGPSKLLTPETVLDVLAVAQHLEGSCATSQDDGSYSIEFSILLNGPSSASSSSYSNLASATTSKMPFLADLHSGTCSGHWTRIISSKPLVAVREVAMDIILNDFLAVLGSSVYASQVEDSISAMASEEVDEAVKAAAPALLLGMCLEELAASPFKGSWPFSPTQIRALERSWQGQHLLPHERD